MLIPLSWIRDFVDITLPLPELCHLLTMAGLEVEGVRIVGLPQPDLTGVGHHKINLEGLSWEADKIVTAAVYEVIPHPNADRLVLCRLDDGADEQIVLTGAPNLYPYKGLGPLPKPLKVPYAREGARIYDGHQPGQVLTTLKRAKIRGVDSYSMICSEKELGISDEHEGVIILDDDAPVGVPLADYIGDAVLDIALTPNIARNANVLGVAREIAALTGQPLRLPTDQVQANGPSIQGKALIEIRSPELNPRFVLGLVQEVKIAPSPYKVQLRLRLAGMRPISNIVDATNYAMLEIGEPLHAFDYDVLVQRAGNKAPTIITRTAQPGERLTTLDDVDRPLDDFTVLVCDTAGALSIAGVMGGAESEISEHTRNILLEGAAWNYINIRRTVSAQKLLSEAAWRFSRGVHPAMAERGVRRCLELMRQWAGGVVAQGLVDNYPLPPVDPVVEITSADSRRWLGIELSAHEMADILQRLEFKVEIHGETVRAVTPDHRLDIGEGLTGVADLMEEVARIYGYERIPETRMADELPPQRNNTALEQEERVRDLLVELGLQEVATYRLTSAEREARRLPPGSPVDDRPYVRLSNPIAVDRIVLRHSLLSSLLEVVERNAHQSPRLGLFEIGPVYLGSEEGPLPDELPRLAIVLSGPRALPGWQSADGGAMDFYDLKGVLEALFAGLHLPEVRFEPAEYPSFHPGKCARMLCRLEGSQEETQLGVFGELHPLVREHYELTEAPLLAADMDLRGLLQAIPERRTAQTISTFPPVLEDLAVIVDEDLPAERAAALIRQSAGKLLASLRLFDVYRGEQIGAGKKSLAYSLAYQAPDHTLTAEEALKIRQRVIRRLEQELGARLRS
ncbi:MAG: phenylalanine--tRNA ligase subunit beta [Anaerolineales bacterium]|nr:phenylalanine--tRNA ligase subunit beta [Anaerolineales bacterium]